jgi:pSer/pThr/pTyr-binding forkhead associated (FHA) protein
LGSSARISLKDNPGQEWELGAAQIFIGSADSSDVRVPDEYVSPRHSRIYFENGSYVIEGLGDPPLMVNGRHVTKQILKNGDEITVSDLKYLFSTQGSSGSALSPSTPSQPGFIGSTPIADSDAGEKICRVISNINPEDYYEAGDYDLFFGRSEDCDVIIPDEYISSRQSRIYSHEGQCVIENLGENPLLINGRPVKTHVLRNLDEITISVRKFTFHVENPGAGTADATIISSAEDMFSVFGDSDDDEIRRRSLEIVRAFEKAHKKTKRRYTGIIIVTAILLVLSGGIAFYQHSQLGDQREIAENLFYRLKEMELKYAKSDNQENLAERKKMLNDYEKLLKQQKIYKKMSREDRLILKMAHMFGECAINIPQGFIDEVHEYINWWQTDPENKHRLKNSITRAKKKKLDRYIPEIMMQHGLPPQYFYLALNETNFNEKIVGPSTRYGFAKGMWQFIPDTARRFGLETGRLVEEPKYDPGDDRHDIQKSTNAAARYIRDIYETKAKASGLLVIASYNWGEHRVIRAVDKMPDNPRERNFWRLLTDFGNQLPEETHNYVFRIFSAAVIGEDPQLFGFDFENPLAWTKETDHTEEEAG